MKVFKNQSGLAVAELLLIAAVLAIIGVIGYTVYSTKNSTNMSNSNAVSSSEVPVVSKITAPAVNSASDLDKALKVLDQNDPDSTSSADLSELENASADL